MQEPERQSAAAFGADVDLTWVGVVGRGRLGRCSGDLQRNQDERQPDEPRQGAGAVLASAVLRQLRRLEPARYEMAIATIFPPSAVESYPGAIEASR